MYSSARIVHTSKINDSVTLQELNDKVFFKLHIPAAIFVSLCIFVGVVGNILVMAIYKTRFRRSNHRYFILFLGVTDLLACISGMPFLLASLRLPYMMTSVIACKVLRCIHYAVNNCSGILLVVIAVERYMKICKPFKKQFSHSQTLYLCMGTVVYSVLVAIPSAVFYGNSTIYTGVGNISGTQCYVADEYAGNRYFEIYMAALLLETFICIVIFAVLYAFIIRKLWASDQFITTMRSINKTWRQSKWKDQVNSKDEHNSVEDSLDSSFKSSNSKERSNPTLNRLRDLHTNEGNGGPPSKNTANLPTWTKQTDMPIAKNCNTKCNTNSLQSVSDESPKLGAQRPRGDIICSDENKPEKHASNPRLSLVIQAKAGGENNDHAVTKETNTLGRHGLVKGLTPVQNQVYEQLLAKQTLERGNKGKASKEKTKKNSKTTARVTVMLFTVTLVFVLAFVPHLTLMLLTIEVNDFINNMSVTQVMVYHVFLRIFIINNVSNPVIYFMFDEKFRTLCKSVFRRRCRSKT